MPKKFSRAINRNITTTAQRAESAGWAWSTRGSVHCSASTPFRLYRKRQPKCAESYGGAETNTYASVLSFATAIAQSQSL